MRSTSRRQIELDLLRIIAMFLVVLVHSAGHLTNSIELFDSDWQVITFIRVLCSFEVPVYFMISGRFFLDPERTMPASKLIGAIKRIVIAFLFWDFIYLIYYLLSGTYQGLGWRHIITKTLLGPGPFWFMFTITLLYAIAPFLREFTKKKKLMEYYLFLFFFFQFISEYGVNLPYIGEDIYNIFGYSNYHFTLGYSGYFILGYYLYKYQIPKKYEVPLYILGILSLVIPCYATVLKSVRSGIFDNYYVEYESPNIIITASAVYTFFIKIVSKIHYSDSISSVIIKLSEWSFGVYLIHELLICIFLSINIFHITNPVIRLPILTLSVVFLSNIIVFFLRKIPHIGKRIT